MPMPDYILVGSAINALLAATFWATKANVSFSPNYG
jgi:hypothetical protein